MSEREVRVRPRYAKLYPELATDGRSPGAGRHEEHGRERDAELSDHPPSGASPEARGQVLRHTAITTAIPPTTIRHSDQSRSRLNQARCSSRNPR